VTYSGISKHECYCEAKYAWKIWGRGWYCVLIQVTRLLSHVFYLLNDIPNLFLVGLASERSWHILVLCLESSAYMYWTSIGLFSDIWQRMQYCVGFEIFTVVVLKSSVFRDTMLCIMLKVNWRFRGICHLHLAGRRISRARNQRESGWQTATLKMEAVCSSETSVDFQQTTRRYILEDRTLHMQYCFSLDDVEKVNTRNTVNTVKPLFIIFVVG
jgi:hypothetical protein